ncbi:MAG: flagellar filament capping protein FliD [Pseudomonadota bacterium]|nr:flagellar filament capping protein FliD [Pseudomonadota bacterium]
MSSVIPPSGASSANTLITSTGIGSGLNISAIVSALTNSFGAAQTSQLTNRQTTLDSQVSAYGTFTSALDTLKLALPPLEDASQLAGFAATVADKTIATATTTSSAVAGLYALQVNNLATSASLTSVPVASTAAALGTGTLTIKVGGASTAITIDSTNNSLAGIAAAINSAPDNPGVSASIISTTAGSRLVLTGTTTGAANAITVTPSGGDGGLSALAFTQTRAAQDASFSINGFAATSASNVVSGAITGVTLNLQQASAANTPTTLSISPDTTSAQASIDKFVTAVNGVLSSIRTLTAFDPSTKTAGPLNGNATLESFQNQLQKILGQVTNGSGVKSLTDLGITAGTNGSYATDDTKLGNALSANLASIGKLLGGANGLATQISNLVDGYTKPGGLLDTINKGLESSLTDVSKQQAALSAQLAAYSATLTAQYNAMDKAVALLKQTQTFLNAEFNPSANASSGTSSSNSSLGSGTLGVNG